MARIANSLAVLRAQIDAAYPNRRKTSDGWIGDSDHAARKSDHNPNLVGVVQALDITHDPANGCDTYRLAEILRANRDPRIKYVISNGRIFSSLISPWEWRPYSGANAHSQHIHISVDDDPAKYDDGRPWRLHLTRTSAKRFTDITATIWNDAMGAYGPIDHSKPCVSLPAPFPRNALPLVRVFGPSGTEVGPVTDKGPWYDGTLARPADPYWETGHRPRAETDPKTNGAGIDLNPVMAARVGISGKGLVDWEFVTQENEMAEPTSSAADLAAQLKTLREQFATTLKALDEMDKRVAALLQTSPPPVVVPAPSTPILEKPGVGTGIFGLILTAVLQSLGTGGFDATQAGTASQLLPIISAGTAALGAAGWWGPVLQIGVRLLEAFMSRKK